MARRVQDDLDRSVELYVRAKDQMLAEREEQHGMGEHPGDSLEESIT
jgi:hypothetical protein